MVKSIKPSTKNEQIALSFYQNHKRGWNWFSLFTIKLKTNWKYLP